MFCVIMANNMFKLYFVVKNNVLFSSHFWKCHQISHSKETIHITHEIKKKLRLWAHLSMRAFVCSLHCILKNLCIISNNGKKSGLFVWHDELGYQRWRPEMEKVFDVNFAAFKEAAIRDMLSLANGSVQMKEHSRSSYVEELLVEKLPCPINYMNQVQCYKWLEKEIKMVGFAFSTLI